MRDLLVNLPPEPWTGCTCAACGAQWPDTPPEDGSPVFCDGVCQAHVRRPVRRFRDSATALAALLEEAQQASVEQLLEMPPPPAIDLRPFDMPGGQG